MGGAEVLAYATRTPPTPHVGQLAGVISSAPLLRQADAVRANPALIAVGGMLGKLLPSLQINVGVASNDISRDPEVNAAYAKDPLCAPIGTYNGVAAMIQGGTKLLQSDYRQWPSKLPLLRALSHHRITLTGQSTSATMIASSRSRPASSSSTSSRPTTRPSFPSARTP